jgi:hypothetical protein
VTDSIKNINIDYGHDYEMRYTLPVRGKYSSHDGCRHFKGISLLLVLLCSAPSLEARVVHWDAEDNRDHHGKESHPLKSIPVMGSRATGRSNQRAGNMASGHTPPGHVRRQLAHTGQRPGHDPGPDIGFPAASAYGQVWLHGRKLRDISVEADPQDTRRTLFHGIRLPSSHRHETLDILCTETVFSSRDDTCKRQNDALSGAILAGDSYPGIPGQTSGTIDPSAVPVPPAVLLFASGLIGLVGTASSRKSQSSGLPGQCKGTG